MCVCVILFHFSCLVSACIKFAQAVFTRGEIHRPLLYRLGRAIGPNAWLGPAPLENHQRVFWFCPVFANASVIKGDRQILHEFIGEGRKERGGQNERASGNSSRMEERKEAGRLTEQDENIF